MNEFKVGDWVVRKVGCRGRVWCERFPPGNQPLKIVHMPDELECNVFFTGYQNEMDYWHAENFDKVSVKTTPLNPDDYL